MFFFNFQNFFFENSPLISFILLNFLIYSVQTVSSSKLELLIDPSSNRLINYLINVREVI